MPRPRHLRRLMALLATTAALLHTHDAAAGDFQASPVRLYLSEDAPSGLLTLVNRGAEPVRLQLGGHTWSESAAGEMRLAPTDALVVFPTLLVLAPGESRRVRVGVTSVPADREESYRLLVEELPSNTPSLTPRQAVAIRMRLSIPVFAAPSRARPAPALETPRLTEGGLVVALVNAGTRHVRTGTLRVTTEPRRGAPMTTEIAGWYLLAGQRREHHVALPPGARCIERVRLALAVEGGPTLESSAVVTDPSCAR